MGAVSAISNIDAGTTSRCDHLQFSHYRHLTLGRILGIQQERREHEGKAMNYQAVRPQNNPAKLNSPYWVDLLQTLKTIFMKHSRCLNYIYIYIHLIR